MGSGKRSSQGFTLIASLLILVLLSGIAAGLLYLVTDEAKMGGNDLEANLAYYGAESGMEDMTSAMAALYESTQSPTEAQIQALANFTTLSMVPGVTYSNQITFPAAGNSTAGMPCVTTQTTAAVPPSCYNTVTSGADTGLYAELTPMTLSVIATRPSGARSASLAPSKWPSSRCFSLACSAVTTAATLPDRISASVAACTPTRTCFSPPEPIWCSTTKSRPSSRSLPIGWRTAT